MGDHDDQIDALSYAIQPWQAEMIRRVASETLRDQAERMAADAKAKVPLYFGHSRGAGKTAIMYATAGAEPYGTVTTIVGPGHPYGPLHAYTPVMSLGTGKVFVLDGPEAGTVK